MSRSAKSDSQKGSVAPPSRASVRSNRSQVPPSRGRPPPPSSRQSSKAQYRPLTSQSTWSKPRRALLAARAFGGLSKARGKLSALTEGDYEYAPSVIPERDNYQMPSSPQIAATLATITDYLKKTELETNFNALLQMLLGLTDLPYNPYPGFMRRFRTYAEKFRMNEKSKETVLKILSAKIELSPLAYIYKPVNCDFAWGLKNHIEVVEPGSISDYVWLFGTLAIPRNRTDRQYDYSIQTMLALTGPAVFQGYLYLRPPVISVRVEFLITGALANKAIEIFVNSVIMDIIHTEMDPTHILLGVQIPKQSVDDPENWQTTWWTYERMLEKKDDFRKLISEAVSGNKYISSECVFCLNHSRSKYGRGQKRYALNYIQVSPSGDYQGMSYFTEYPLITLHEGIFMKQADAASYLSTFTPRSDLIEKLSEVKSESSKPDKSAGKKGKAKQETGTWKGDTAPRVRVDGFLLGDRSEYAPDAWQITAPIKSYWQRTIAGLNTTTEIFEIVHLILLLTLMDKDGYEDTIFVEIYRMQQSTAARLYALMQLNKTIREVIMKYEGELESELVTSLFIQYKLGLSELLDGKLQERSSDLVTCGRAANTILEELAASSETGSDNIPATRQNLEILKNLNSYTYTLFLGLVEDALDLCPAIAELIRTLKKTFPEEVARPHTAIRKRYNKKRREVGAGKGEVSFPHGLEDENIMKHDKQVVNVEMCMERETAPKVIAVESVLLKYITDTHLDDMWPSFLLELVTGTMLPPNPYPRLITRCRHDAIRMDLCYESIEKLKARLTHSAARPEDPSNHVYTIPGCDAHGLQTAIDILDTGAFYQLVPIVSKFIQKDFKMRHGAYKVAICCAVSGFTPLYGRIDPYLHQIELHEHCYMRGPDACSGEAIQVYSKIVYEHLRDLYRQKAFFITGLYMGEEGVQWNLEDVLNKKKGYSGELEGYCINREPVYIKAYVAMGWRLVPVIKYFKFHYINDEETEHDMLFPDNVANLYQNVFLDKERAAFHFQYGGPPDRSNPYNSSNLRQAGRAIEAEILTAMAHQEWLTVHRWLLLKNIITQGSSVVPETWRVLHSAASRVEYCISLATSLQDLLRYALDLQQRKKNQATYYNVTSEEDDDEVAHRLETSMGQMVMAYRQKVTQVLASHSTLAPRSLLMSVNTKLQAITERDEITLELFLICNLKSVFVLDEVIHMMKALEQSVAYDVHSICPESQAMLRSIQVENTMRPSSVASHHLNDHLKYKHTPMAKNPDYVDDWSDL